MHRWPARLLLLSAAALIAPTCGKVSGTPGPFTLTFPADGAAAVPVDAGGGLSFAWTASATADSYTFELATSANFQTLVQQMNSSGAPGLTPSFALTHSTTYFWRVTARSSLGSIVADNAPFSFTTVAAGPGPPGAFTLTAPSDGAPGVSTSPTFSWGSSADATSYTLDIATDAAFTAMTASQSGIVSTSAPSPVTLNPGASYFWKVTAVNGGGTRVATGAPFSFSTVPPTPGPFVMTSPSDGATGVAAAPTFSWSVSADAASYTLEVASDAGFATIVGSQSGITSTSASPVALSSNTTYHWRVTAINGPQSTTATGAPFSFTTAIAGSPGPFTLSSPANGVENHSRMPTFQWTASAGATSYTLEIATNAGFSPVAGSQSGIPGTSAPSPITLNASTMYFWRVTAVNGNGPTLASGAPFSFTTTGMTLPASFSLLSPSDGSAGEPLVPTFTWQTSFSHFTYTLEIAGDAAFTVMIGSSVGLVTTSALSPRILSQNTIYFWRVKAENGAGYTVATGSPRMFTTAASGVVPGPFTLTAPANGATGVSRAPTFTWTSAPSATHYGLEISTNPGFSAIVGRKVGGAGTSMSSPIFLSSSTTYHWRVFSASSGAVGPPAGPFSFTTVGAASGSPDPAFGADGIVIDWVDLAEANAVIVLSDGRIVTGGGAADGVYDGTNVDFTLARYLPDGSLDATFGIGGKVRTKVAGFSDNILGMALQADGKIVAAGLSFNSTDNRILLARYDSGGSLDPTFGTGGLVVTTLAGSTNCFARTVAVQSDQKIVVGGQSTFGNFLLVRYNSDGTLDGSFGTGGICSLPFAVGGNERCHKVAIQSDGMIVACGQGTSTSGGPTVIIAARYTAAGALDPTFNSTGFDYTSVEIGTANSMAPSLALQGDGKIVVAGRALSGGDVAILRFLTDGTLDAGFDGDGIVIDSFAGWEEANAVLVQPDGKIVIAGFTGLSSRPHDAMIARYTATGARDLTFDGDGLLVLPLGISESELRALAWTPDNRIIAVGLGGGQVVLRIDP